MSTLLALSIGPVQEFIASARRTRDLWFGSKVLSEISRTAASAVQQEHGNLIFPTEQDLTQENTAVANIILAELPSDIVPGDVAEKARKMIEARWKTFADDAREIVINASKGAETLCEDLWSFQLNDALEFYAAWTPIHANQYGQARKRVMRLLSGRKVCRNFEQPQGAERVRRVPKSSLDGRHESVLQENIPQQVRTNLRLNKGEQLCAIGLTKRLAGGTKSYPSVSRIAADPWLRRVAQSAQNDDKVKEAFVRLKSICSGFKNNGSLYALDPSQFSQFKHFPYEGTCLFPSRFEDWKKETGLTGKELEPLLEVLSDFKKLGLGEPDPYLAILVADGDHIGKHLSQIKEPDDHRKFSQALTKFAKEAYDMVKEHNGICIFAGGDDVLAFVPADQCLSCARKLRERFQEICKAVNIGLEPTTFSVGIAIAHCMEPLEDLRSYGSQAEKAAKAPTPLMEETVPFDNRNGLAVRVHPRSGVDIKVREQWQADENSLDKRLEYWADLFRERKLPRKLPHDLRAIAGELNAWPSMAPSEAVEAEICVLLKRKQVNKDLRKTLEEKLKSFDSAVALLRLAEEMLVSQWIADAQQDLINNQEIDL